jgi:hypothetical protein
MKTDPIQPLYCNVRGYGGTYIASGEKSTASCTAGAEQAALRWASKTFTRNLGRPIAEAAIQVKPTTKGIAYEIPVTYRCEVVE